MEQILLALYKKLHNGRGLEICNDTAGEYTRIEREMNDFRFIYTCHLNKHELTEAIMWTKDAKYKLVTYDQQHITFLDGEKVEKITIGTLEERARCLFGF